jgi:hypothetical protein
MPNRMPSREWSHETHYTREHVSQVLNNEVLTFQTKFDPYEKQHDGNRGKGGYPHYTRIEQRMAGYWDVLNAFVSNIYEPNMHHGIGTEDFESYLDEIKHLRKALEKLRMPGTTNLKPEDEPTMFHENMLMACYQQMEVLQATCRFIDHLRKRVIKVSKGDKPHPHKKNLPQDYDTKLLEETQICFQAVRDVAQSYVDLILRRGVEAIKAQVRWGPTGKELEEVLSDDDVELYAQEYVESALEGWRGVLKVKLK